MALDMKRVLNVLMGNGDVEVSGGNVVEGFECLFRRSFVELSSAQGPLYVALRRGKHVLCLLCLLSEKVEVEFDTKSELLSHIEVAHTRLFDFMSKHTLNPTIGAEEKV